MTKAKRGNGQGSVRRLPSGNWQWTITLDTDASGKQIRRSGTEKTKGEAEKAKAQAIADHTRGGLAAPNRVTLGEWLDRWLASRESQVKPKTYSSYARSVRLYIKPHLGSKRLQEIRPADVRYLQDKIRSAGLGTDTQRLALGALSMALKEAVSLELITRNPAEGIKVISDRQREGRSAQAWTAEEVARFIEVAQQDRQGMVLVFMVSLGLRRGEACGLRWANVDLERGLCRIVENLVTLEGQPHVSTPKSVNGRRTVLLSQEAAALLRAWQVAQAEERVMLGESWQDTGYVFTTYKGTHLHPDNLNRALSRLCEQAGLRRIRVHDLRHTYASLMLSRQVPLEVVSKHLGHASPSFTLNTYRHVAADEQARYVINLSELVRPFVK